MPALPPVTAQLLWDGSQFEAGTSAAKASLEELEATTEATATTLSTDLPVAADTAAVGLTTKASKFKSVGTELGQTLAQGIGSGVSGPEQVANLGNSVAGLAAPLAATGAGAVAAIGLGLGGALISNMIKAANQRREEFVTAVVAGFQEVEVKAKSSFADIRADLLATYDTKDLLSELTKLGVSTDQLTALSEDIGKPWYELAQVLRGDITPANRDTLAALEEQSKELDFQTKTAGNIRNVYTDQAKLAQDLLDVSNRRTDTLKESLALARLEKDALNGAADASERALAAAERLGGALGNAVRQAGLLDLAINGVTR